MRFHQIHPGIIALVVIGVVGGVFGVYWVTRPEQKHESLSADDAVRVPRDNSLSAEAYVKAGAPPAERVWGEAEYQQAVKALTPIATRDATELPRAESAKSGTYFSRMVATENFARLSDASIPAATRWTLAQALAKSWEGLVPLYIKYSANIGAFDNEVAQLLAAKVRLHLATIEVMEQAGFAAPSGDRAQRIADVLQMRKRFADTATQALEAIAAPETLRLAARRSLVETLGTTLPKLAPETAPFARASMPKRLAPIAEKEPDAALKSSLEKLLKELRESPGASRLDRVIMSIPPVLSGAATRVSSTSPTSQPGLAAWEFFVLVEGKFMAEFPMPATGRSMGIPPSKPVTLAHYMATGLENETPDPDTPIFSVLSEEADPNAPLAPQLEYLSTILDRPNKPVENVVIKNSTHPARDVFYRSPTTVIVVRLFGINGRIYYLKVQGPTRDERALREDAQRFFESFRLLEN